MILNNIASGHISPYQLALTGISLAPYEVIKTKPCFAGRFLIQNST